MEIWHSNVHGTGQHSQIQINVAQKYLPQCFVLRWG